MMNQSEVDTERMRKLAKEARSNGFGETTGLMESAADELDALRGDVDGLRHELARACGNKGHKTYKPI